MYKTLQIIFIMSEVLRFIQMMILLIMWTTWEVNNLSQTKKSPFLIVLWKNVLNYAKKRNWIFTRLCPSFTLF